MAGEAKMCGFTWMQWLSLYCVAFFIMLHLDAGMSHAQAVHHNRYAATPMLFCPLGVLVSVACIFFPAWRRGAWSTGLLAMLVGAMGTYFHLSPLAARLASDGWWQALSQSSRPVFAPAAFISAGLLLLLISWGEWSHRVRPASPRASAVR